MGIREKAVFAPIAAVFLFVAVYAAAIADNGASEYYLYDRVGDLRLVGKSKDIYLERFTSGEIRKITATPDVYEPDAFFSNDGRYVLYRAENKKRAFDKTPEPASRYFIQPVDDTDLKRKEIDQFLYKDYKKERLKAKANETEEPE